METKSQHTSSTTAVFTLEFLENITDNFAEERIIGHGGYGIVYKGVLDTGEEIAVKKLHHMSGLDDKQFRNEFNNLMRVQHPNIIRLVGYCYDIRHKRMEHNGENIFALMEERALCFEYLHGGGLDKHLSDESCGLDWHIRYNLIKGVCEGLNYLHNGCKDPIYHLDLKPANILLDKHMVPKIGDFGLSRLFTSAHTYVTIKVIGTPGYMPPEYIERNKITSKFDVFSLGVIIIQVMAGPEGYYKSADMPSHEFIKLVHENWRKRQQETMSLHISQQIKICIELALRCVQVDRLKRPTISEILDKLNEVSSDIFDEQHDKFDDAQSSPIVEVTNFPIKQAFNQSPISGRGQVAFCPTNRPPVPLDIFSCPIPPSSSSDEIHLTDGISCNYNGRSIPPEALKALIKRPKIAEESGATEADVDIGRVSGLVFISERADCLETLYVALRFNAENKVKVFSLADIFGAVDFSGARLEDSGCFGGGYSVGSRTVDHCLVYVSTKQPAQERHSAGTVVYKTNLRTGTTERLTPEGSSDLSPAVSPSGKLVAVASFRRKSWYGEIDELKTDIYMMDVDSEGEGLERKLLIRGAGWPSWGSDTVIFFHRKIDETLWGVFRYDFSTDVTVRVTPKTVAAVTPAAISDTKVAVVIWSTKSGNTDGHPVESQDRHVEIFDMAALDAPIQITQKTTPEGHHYNPFVLDLNGGRHIGYHRYSGDFVPRVFEKLESPLKDVGLLRVSGLNPTISKDGSKLAFFDESFKAVWLADCNGMRKVFERSRSSCFTIVWNQNPEKDTLYICVGLSIVHDGPLEIYSLYNVSGSHRGRRVSRLTTGNFNNAYPSSNPEGTKIVFRSSRHGGEQRYKNLYIMEDADSGEFCEGAVTRLTHGRWTDTHCQWSPNGDWIVFSSTRDMPTDMPERDIVESGCFAVFLVKATDRTAVIRVIDSGLDFRGLNYPVFSPDGRSIAVTADIAAASAEPISMFHHRVQPYGDVFMVDLRDGRDITKNRDIEELHRLTHSRYDCRVRAWTLFASSDQNTQWSQLAEKAVRTNLP